MSTLRAITSVRLQAAYGAEQGVPVSVALAGSGIDAAMLNQADATIESAQELKVIENLCAHLDDPVSHGLAMGQRYHLSSYGVWGFALLSSPTFGDAIRLGVRYLGLTFAFVDVRLQETRDNAVLVLEDAGLPEVVRPYLLARDASAIMVIQEELFSLRVPLTALRLRLPDRDPEQVISLFGREPVFDSAVSEAAFARGLLDMPLPQANPVTARLCEEQCHQLLVQRHSRGGTAARLRRRLLQQPGHFPSLETLAEELHMSPRTLRRHLNREGTGYQELLDEVRRMLAEQWLTLGILTLEEISERLGYSELSNFIHAFRRWTGQTPARYRRGRVAG
ncbi:MAG: AraC family transcriptional regulator [Alcanivoracaceae bacterium]|uniref:AraC family transcriptional regulator n=1 Tax=Alcanivorax sp. MD8A TaxID=1177157 RepID=UPI000C65DC00|nr:AraC family transcriptional regulator [Alcanivorax sp. MD8A]MAX57093.1 AraC family transcriptional regulator [Alcanivoracaceae bacterium]MCG8437828.1 AraC family transcriptional regulator [Pseudomonadales bacterium]MED5430750.1 AraC family transcriptional regulator [Pseudomonadota bacterium]MEE2869866.1 AraC family transcriptional regulator [Pseudomonadota bacterium]PNE02289.1 AraC family transcriptional regulator [Alcanivorax sp. MD8A]